MLIKLSIRNYAIIQESTIQFDKGLNIITGETGAGKSILMGALGLILGDRADSTVLRNAEEKCIVEGVFEIRNKQIKQFFIDNDLDFESKCILRREINTSGKSRAFINDTPVNLQQLKELGIQLVEVVSQHETLDLNQSDFQLKLVDILAENNNLLNQYSGQFLEWKRINSKLKELREEEEKSKRDEEYFKFILKELEDINPLEDEQELLEKLHEKLLNADSIQQAATSAITILDEQEGSVIEQIRSVKSSMNAASRHHDTLHEVLGRLESVLIELKDISSELNHVAQSSNGDPAELNRVEERLKVLFDIQKKHRVSDNAELIRIKNKISDDLMRIDTVQEQINQLEKEEVTALNNTKALAQELFATRSKVIPLIEKKVKELLKQVEMPDASLKVEIANKETYSISGNSEIRFMFSANKGANLQPINKVASGGELSRLMLCIKSLMSDSVDLPTIIFDEIDTGISGEAARKVALVMKDHAKKHQVIAITHLAQIAGKADSHYNVYKSSDSQTTYTGIKKLDKQESLHEIARMLHGSNPSDKVIEAARELING